MKLIIVVVKRWYLLILPVAACGALAGIVLSTSSAKKPKAQRELSRSEIKRKFHAQLKDGVGKEVKFETSTDSQILESVNSTVDFIERQSGVTFSDNVRDRIKRLQTEAAAGRARKISSEDLVNALTDTAMERIANASDSEIDETAATMDRPGDGINMRANGRGHMSRNEFVSQAKALRNFSKQNDATSRAVVKSAVSEQVNGRITNLAQALPAQFGSTPGSGLMPAQAVLVTYSVVADDQLAQSAESLRGNLDRLYHFRKSHGQNEPRPEKAYGRRGYVYAAPLQLLLDEKTTNKLLDRIEERSKK